MKILLVMLMLIGRNGYSASVSDVDDQVSIQKKLIVILKLQKAATKLSEFHVTASYFTPKRIGLSAYFIDEKNLDSIMPKVDSKLIFSIFPKVTDKEEGDLKTRSAGLEDFKFSSLKYEESRIGKIDVEKFTYLDVTHKVLMVRCFDKRDGFEMSNEFFDTNGNATVSEFNRKAPDDFKFDSQDGKIENLSYAKFEKEFSKKDFKADRFCFDLIEKKFFDKKKSSGDKDDRKN